MDDCAQFDFMIVVLVAGRRDGGEELMGHLSFEEDDDDFIF